MNETPLPDPSASHNERLLVLEERLAYQQRLIDQLNEVILRQQVEIEKLARGLTGCRTSLQRLSALGEDLPHEKPPHY